jgi:hypothetical protein
VQVAFLAHAAHLQKNPFPNFRGQTTPGRGGGRTGPGPVSVPGEARVSIKSEPHQDSSSGGGALEAGSVSAGGAAPVSNISTLASGIFSHVADEYDPSRPNDYEEVRQGWQEGGLSYSKALKAKAVAITVMAWDGEGGHTSL